MSLWREDFHFVRDDQIEKQLYPALRVPEVVIQMYEHTPGGCIPENPFLSCSYTPSDIRHQNFRSLVRGVHLEI